MPFGSNVRRHVLKLAALASVSLLPLTAQAQTTARPVQPLYGDIRPFYGDIRPFYGDIRPFYGDLRPFYGDIRPFWGDIRPFWGDIRPFSGDVTAFWGDIRPFTGSVTGAGIEAFWTVNGSGWDKLSTTWSGIAVGASAADYTPVAAQLTSLVDSSRTFWGAAVMAKTGQSFDQAFANPLLARYGVNLSDPGSLAALSASDRALFFLDWYDGLMNFTGTDHVDHWMHTVNWTPQLTQTQGSGRDTVIGLLDFTVAGDTVIQQNIIKFDGVSNFTNGHGAAVASLIVGAHDGQGVMGIAPKASVIAYNPFDASGTASWDDITKGVLMLANNHASIINMSLGVPGATLSQGWDDVFSNTAGAAATKKALFVVAAGNEGIVQKRDVTWNYATNPNLIVVGSIDLAGNISNFSNTPGYACLLDAGVCKPGAKLMDHFIVAPGELILVSDDHGGVTRVTGTSVSAPLVSGAVALLHDRWPWLASYPKETADIILKSAKDLGAPGVDSVYGVGLLDVTASQSPLNFSALTWYQSDDKAKLKALDLNKVISTAQSEKQAKFDAKGIYFYAFETIGGTQRDFAIPLSQKLIGQNVTTASGAQEQFQAYLLSRMDSWVTAQTTTTTTKTFAGFSPGLPIANAWGADMSLSIAPRTATYGFRQDGAAYQSRLHVAGERTDVDLGFGDGAVSLGALPGFSQAADYDSDHGGANPLLGLASGGGYANVNFALSDRLQLSAGATQRDQRRDTNLLPALATEGNGAERYTAAAQHVALNYRLADGVNLVGAYTRLKEGSSLLGIQSMDAQDFAGGTVTDGFSVGFGADLGHDTTLALSGTVGRTRAGSGHTIAVDTGGLTSTAFEVALTKANLFSKGDVARLSLSQPMFVQQGRLNITTVQVIDRDTGAIGAVTQSFDVSQSRPFAAEVLYGRKVGDADLSLFGRADVNPSAAGRTDSYMVGGRVRLGF